MDDLFFDSSVLKSNYMPARIEEIQVKKYRALRDVTLKNLTPFTVLIGPNGSGKSTIFDVFNFLSECFQFGLRHAWDRRGRMKELLTRSQSGPISIELKYREKKDLPLITYHLEIDEKGNVPIVAREWLAWRRSSRGKPFRFLEYECGKGRAVSGDMPDEKDQRLDIPLRSPDLIAVNTLGQFAEHPRVAALREFIKGWYVSYLSVDDTRNQPEAGPQDTLSKTGDNLPNVVQFLREQHPVVFEKIIKTLKDRVPKIKDVDAEAMPDGRLLLSIKDGPFDKPILSRFTSDGTLKLLAYLVVLNNPNPPQFIGIEEPENFLHHRLLPDLAEECESATDKSQLLVTTHSPFFINRLKPEQLRLLYRDDNGFTVAKATSEIEGIREFIKEGASLGDLWMEGHFKVGDPLGN